MNQRNRMKERAKRLLPLQVFIPPLYSGEEMHDLFLKWNKFMKTKWGEDVS